MDAQHLVSMVNDIAAFFASETDKDAAAGQVASHVQRFWEPRMRKALREYASTGGTGLSDLARQAVKRLQ